MLRRATNWLKGHAVIIVLCACTVLSAVCWTVNTIWPAPVYGYLSELAFLVCIGLGALWLFRDSPTAAVTLYFSGALLSVGSMIEHFAPGFTPLVATPFVGVFVVSVLTQCPHATTIYTVAASLAGAIIGLLYSDVGGAVAGAIVTAMAGGVQTYGCAVRATREQSIQSARVELERVCAGVQQTKSQTGQLERGLDQLLEESMNEKASSPP